MKIRVGFVGNSSSSSFIIGLGRIKNISKIPKGLPSDDCFVLSLNWDRYDDGGDLLDSTDTFGIVNAREATDATGVVLEIEAFTGAEVSLLVSRKDKTVLAVYYTGEEGDDAFNVGDWTLEYSIDRDFFCGNAEAESILSTLGNPDIVDDVDMWYGAGRNG